MPPHQTPPETDGHWRPVTKQEALDRTQLPDNPRQQNCAVCDTIIGDEDWDWAAMPNNGPVHNRCFMTDQQLMNELLTDSDPCTGCDTNCNRYKECVYPDVLGFSDGVNNCMIVAPRPELDHIAEEYRSQGYKVVH